MCHLTVAIDQSVDSVGCVFDVLAASEFYIRSVRLVPVARSSNADVHFSLGGVSGRDLEGLVGSLNSMPAVLSTSHVPPASVIARR